jgi:hypothetical protein
MNSFEIQYSRWIESVAEKTADITAGCALPMSCALDTAQLEEWETPPLRRRERVKEDISVDRSSRFQLWHFCNCFYLAIFRGIFVNVLILVVGSFEINMNQDLSAQRCINFS